MSLEKMIEQCHSFAIKGRVLHFLRQPESKFDIELLEYFQDGLLWIEQGYIKALGHTDKLSPKLPADLPIEDQ